MDVDGKGVSVMDVEVLLEEYSRQGVLGYLHTKEDLALMKEMGVTCLRTSFNWPRIFQTVMKASQMKKG